MRKNNKANENIEITKATDFQSQSVFKSLAYENFFTDINTPAYETGYFDLIVLSREFAPDPDFTLDFNNVNANYLFSVDNVSFNAPISSEFDGRLAGEGPNPNTFRINQREFMASVQMPLKVESWGFLDFAFQALYDFCIEGYKGSPTSYIGRFTSSNSAVIGTGTTILYIDSPAEFTAFTTPFSAKIKSDVSDAIETVTVSGVGKTNNAIYLSSGVAGTHSRSTSYLYAYPSNNLREPSFSLFSLKEGLLAGCLVDKISLRFSPGDSVVADIDLKILDVNKKYQIDMLNNFDTLVQNYKKKNPSYLLRGSGLRIYKTTPEAGYFGLGLQTSSKFFRGFQQIDLNNIFINEVTIEISNNLKPIYSLNSKNSDPTQKYIKNNLPFGYYSEGRKVSGSITYTGPIKSWSFAEFLAGPSSINDGGITLDMGPAKIELPEVVWSPDVASYSVNEPLTKKINFSVVTQKYSFDPTLNSTV
jgi:hypothetical protein